MKWLCLPSGYFGGPTDTQAHDDETLDWSHVFTLATKAFKHQELDYNKENLISIPLDGAVHGSMLHSMWPSRTQKKDLFLQGKLEGLAWLNKTIREPDLDT